jgi:hypothetical protein
LSFSGLALRRDPIDYHTLSSETTFLFERDSKEQTSGHILEEKNHRILRRRNFDQSRFELCMDLGRYRARKQANSRTFLANISNERNMLIALRFISYLKRIHGKHPVSIDGGTWYQQACEFLKIDHHRIHFSSLEKSIIERTIQDLKDKTKIFDDFFLSQRKVQIRAYQTFEQGVCLSLYQKH